MGLAAQKELVRRFLGNDSLLEERHTSNRIASALRPRLRRPRYDGLSSGIAPSLPILWDKATLTAASRSGTPFFGSAFISSVLTGFGTSELRTNLRNGNSSEMIRSPPWGSTSRTMRIHRTSPLDARYEACSRHTGHEHQHTRSIEASQAEVADLLPWNAPVQPRTWCQIGRAHV